MTVLPQMQTPPAQGRWHTIGIVILFLLLILGLLWILSLLGILDTSWAVLLSAIFTILSVLLALVSWIWPRSSVATPALLMVASQAQGTLEVLVRPELCGSTVYIDGGFHAVPPHDGRAMTIRKRRNGNTVEFVAEQTLDPGNYTVSINANEPVAHVTIIAGKCERIDWRHICP